MPVYITDENALDRIMEVECHGMDDTEKCLFRKNSLSLGRNTFERFRQAFTNLSAESRKSGRNNYMSIDGYQTFHGHNGNRYAVRRTTGEVVLVKRHTFPVYCSYAKEVGITVN